MNLLTTAFKFLNLIGGFSAVGALLAMAFLVINKDGFLTTSGEKLRRFLTISSAVWLLGAVGTIIFTLAQILGTSITDAFDLTVIRSFLTQISLGKYLAFQALMALVVLLFSFTSRKIEALIILLGLSIAGLVAPVFESHAAWLLIRVQLPYPVEVWGVGWGLCATENFIRCSRTFSSLSFSCIKHLC